MLRWLAVLLCAATIAHAQVDMPGMEVPDLDPPAQGELVAEHKSVAPGGTIWVGVRITLKPMWHVYWINPGDSGTQPILKWKLPEGVTAAPFRWPAPHLLPQGPLMMYGYDDEVLLPLELSVPKGYEAKSLRVGVRATWLVCADVCLDGGTTREIEIPVRKGEPKSNPEKNAEWAPLFARTRAALPRSPPAGALFASSAGLEIDLKRLPLDEKARVHFYPRKSGRIEHAAKQLLTRKGQRAALFIPWTATAKNQKNCRLDGVLVVQQGKTRRAYVVDLPVTESDQ